MSAAGELVSRLAGRRVLVAGDVMLDHFLVGRVDRISPEAPVPVVRFERDEFRLGGAANVAQNIASLGGLATLVGLVGQDEAGMEVGRQLRRAGLDDRGLVIDPTRPTTRKMRVVTSRNQQVVRVDHEEDAAADGDALAGLITLLQSTAAPTDAIVLSDYSKGVVTPAVIAAAAEVAHARRIPLLVDPKVAQAERYRGVSLITPNHHEAELMTRVSVRTTVDAARAGRWLHERTGASVLITRGEHGMWILDASSSPAREHALPAVAREVADVTGAGDTVIAVLALALASGATLREAAELANTAAGLVVARFGPAAITAAELTSAMAPRG